MENVFGGGADGTVEGDAGVFVADDAADGAGHDDGGENGEDYDKYYYVAVDPLIDGADVCLVAYKF